MTVQFNFSVPVVAGIDVQSVSSAGAGVPTMAPVSLTPLAAPASGVPAVRVSDQEASPVVERRLVYFGELQRQLLGQVTAATLSGAGSADTDQLPAPLRAGCVVALTALATWLPQDDGAEK